MWLSKTRGDEEMKSCKTCKKRDQSCRAGRAAIQQILRHRVECTVHEEETRK
jgi:hypothetical protein